MDRIYCKKENIITREIVGETLLVPIRGELANMQKLFALEDVSAFIWEELDGVKTLGFILERVTDSFEVDRRGAETDLVEFIDALEAAELIEEKI
jgi:Coenzyme PQQ synthesis protein D (PqqD)